MFFLDQQRSRPKDIQSVIGRPSIFQAILMRRNSEQEWKRVPDAVENLWDGSERCNSTVMHVVTLSQNSVTARLALPGDKVGLRIVVDSEFTLTIENAEIELHAQLERP